MTLLGSSPSGSVGSGSGSGGKDGSGGGGRKPKISRPTDPRPIRDAGVYGASPGSRSVLDLSRTQTNSFDIPRFPPGGPPSVPSSPTIPNLSGPSPSPSASSPGGGGLGDLRGISKRAWSRSADDLSRVGGMGSSPVKPPPMPISFQERVAEYRARSDSVASSAGSPTSPSPGHQHPLGAGLHPHQQQHSPQQQQQHPHFPFPTLSTTPPSSTPILGQQQQTSPRGVTTSIPRPPPGAPRMGGGGQRSATLPTLSVSISSPTSLDEGGLQQPGYRGRKTSGNTLGSLSPQSLTPTSAVSPSVQAGGGSGGLGLAAGGEAAGQAGQQQHVHTRSHSFTPKMPSKLATPTYPPQPTTASPTTTTFSFNRVPSPSPISPHQQVYAGSTTSLLSNANSRSGGEDGQSQQSHGGGNNRKTGFFGSMMGGGEGGSGRTTKLSSSPKTGAPMQHRNLLSPPLIVEPKGHYTKRSEKERAAEDEDGDTRTDSRRSSQILMNSGFVNYLFTSPSSFSHTSSSSSSTSHYTRLNVPQPHASSSSLNLHANQHHQQHLQQQLANPKAWKPYKLELKGSKLHFYKVPSDRASGVKDLFPSGLVVSTSASDEDEEAEGGDGEHAHEGVKEGDRKSVV